MLTIDKFIETTKNSSTTSFDTADNIAQNFFLVDDNNKNILEDEEVLKELLRRVTVFHDALEHSKNIYNAFSNAYK